MKIFLLLFFVDMLLPIVVVVDLLPLLFLVTMMPTILLFLVAHGCCSLATESKSDLVPESNATKQAHAQAHRPGVRSPFSQGDPHYTGENGDGGSPFSWGPQNFMTPALQTGLRNCSRTFALNFGRENDGKPLVLYAT